MAWVTTPSGRRYYYRSVRQDDGSVRREYLGSGERAEAEAKRQATKRTEIKLSKTLIQAEQEGSLVAQLATDRALKVGIALSESSLLVAGFWRGRNYQKWRRRRVRK